MDTHLKYTFVDNPPYEDRRQKTANQGGKVVKNQYTTQTSKVIKRI